VNNPSLISLIVRNKLSEGLEQNFGDQVLSYRLGRTFPSNPWWSTRLWWL